MESNIYPNDLQSTYNPGMTQLMTLFDSELRDILSAEKTVTNVLTNMIENVTSKDLKGALQNHLEEKRIQINRLAQIFQLIGTEGPERKCEAMEGLLKEAETIMRECEVGPVMDAGIISAAQKVEHYGIASYGTLRQFADTLGLFEIEEMLEKSLEEDRATDKELSDIAIFSINMQAVNQQNEWN